MMTRNSSIWGSGLALAFWLGSVAFASSQTQTTAQTDSAAVATAAYQAPSPEGRYLAFISDLHFGIGKKADGSWDPTEDFRWPRALEGFLKALSTEGHEKVDLVIVGDFLELWQPPPDITCTGMGANFGCTLEEMGKLSGIVAKAHDEELALLRAFAERGENRLHLIPGNHDSTLRYEQVWRPIGAALHADSGRIELVTSGIWSSPAGKVVAEHGHQIGLDVNGYDNWPDIVEKINGIDYVVRPWGELFVQKLFNEEEHSYEIIDNLMPESVGVSIRAAERGRLGTAADSARFILFNLWDASSKQAAIMLGAPPDRKPEWNIRYARDLGADLFLNALNADDPLRGQISGDSAEARATKAQLAQMAHDASQLPDEAVLHLCDLGADRNQKYCIEAQLGSAVLYALDAKDKILARHLRNRQKQFRAIRYFIYGHTHQYEDARSIALNDLFSVTIANTGAFQRLIDEEGFRSRLDGKSPQEALHTMRLEQLPACYGVITMSDESAAPKVRAWFMDEQGPGQFVLHSDRQCK
ncbi:metallophosphoesterase [Bradyrhizobium sp. UFLA05-109]